MHKLLVYKHSQSRLVVEFDPVDWADNLTKRLGLVLWSMAEFEAFNEVYEYNKLSKLLGMLEGVNQIKTGKERKEEKIIELNFYNK